MSELNNLGGRILELLDRKSEVTFDDLKRCQHAVHDRCEHLRCPVFNKAMPSEVWYRKYIDSQHNMFLIDTDVGLSPSTHGAVIKRKVSKKRSRLKKDKYLFFIYLSPQLKEPFHRLFTVAHEIAHVLLHGRILHPGMHIVRRSHEWHQYRQRLAQLMEVEANLFAMYSLIPDGLIRKLDDQMKCRVSNATRVVIVRQVLSNLYNCQIDYGLVKERLFIGAKNRDYTVYQSQSITNYPFKADSWMLNGYLESEKQFRSARYRRLERQCKDLSESISNKITREREFSPLFSFSIKNSDRATAPLRGVQKEFAERPSKEGACTTKLAGL